MGNVARKPRRSPETVLLTTPARHLTEDIHEEILLRLPAKSVLRFRAVCKAWRRIAADPRFLAAHARRRPAQAVLYRYIDATPYENRPDSSVVDIALDVIPVSGELAGRRRLIRYPQLWTDRKWTPADAERRRVSMCVYCFMIASCHGVLLFKKDQGFYLLCNPITRQWAQLPRLVDEIYHLIPDVEYAFYFHQPSGEYRLLCGDTLQLGASSPAAPPSLAVQTRTSSPDCLSPTCGLPCRLLRIFTAAYTGHRTGTCPKQTQPLRRQW